MQDVLTSVDTPRSVPSSQTPVSWQRVQESACHHCLAAIPWGFYWDWSVSGSQFLMLNERCFWRKWINILFHFVSCAGAQKATSMVSCLDSDSDNDKSCMTRPLHAMKLLSELPSLWSESWLANGKTGHEMFFGNIVEVARGCTDHRWGLKIWMLSSAASFPVCLSVKTFWGPLSSRWWVWSELHRPGLNNGEPHRPVTVKQRASGWSSEWRPEWDLDLSSTTACLKSWSEV